MDEARSITSRSLQSGFQQRNVSRDSRRDPAPAFRGHDVIPQRPQFSLAGNGYSQAPSYIDPRYIDHNPRYNRQENKPVWGLAKPLPRMVRRGRDESTVAIPSRKRQGLGRPTHTMEDGTEPSPQVARIPDQRAEELEDPAIRDDGEGQVGHIRSRSLSSVHSSVSRIRDSKAVCSGGRGGRIREETGSSPLQSRPAQEVLGTRNPAAWNSIERYGSPEKEKSDPFEQYLTTHTDAEKFEDFGVLPPRNRPSTSRFISANSEDVTLRKLSDVAEVESVLNPSLSRQRFNRSDTIVEDTTACPSDRRARSAQSSHVTLDLEAQTQTIEDGKNLYDWEEQEYYDTTEENGQHNFWSPIRDRFREPLAEGLATFTSTILAVSTNLSILTSSSTAGSYTTGSFASGLGVMLGIYIAGGISGAHINPAISIILCIFRGFPPRKMLLYILAQCIGAYLAALVAFGIYRNAILNLDGGVLQAGIQKSGEAFLTGPKTWTGPAEAWANEFVATGLLACAILALGDDQNSPPGAGMHALIVGLVITGLGMAFGYPTGPCLNPARDLGPRLAILTLGYGGKVFESNDAWWLWGAWASTIGGALFGSLLYDVCIFIGGESPVNYLGRQRKFRAARRQKKKRFLRWWAYGSERSKVKGNK